MCVSRFKRSPSLARNSGRRSTQKQDTDVRRGVEVDNLLSFRNERQQFCFGKSKSAGGGSKRPREKGKKKIWDFKLRRRSEASKNTFFEVAPLLLLFRIDSVCNENSSCVFRSVLVSSRNTSSRILEEEISLFPKMKWGNIFFGDKAGTIKEKKPSEAFLLIKEHNHVFSPSDPETSQRE